MVTRQKAPPKTNGTSTNTNTGIKRNIGGIVGTGTINTRSLFGRMMSTLRSGLSFGGKRDLYEVYGYQRILDAESLLAKYERQDITSRIVNTPVEETWSYPPKIKSTDKAFTDSWDQLKITRWAGGLWPVLTQADKLCAFGEYATIWVGLPGAAPENPAGERYKPDDVLFLQAYGASNVTIDSLEDNPSNPRFGLPKTYAFKTSDSAIAITVHYSRIIHICDSPLQGKTIGIPRLHHVYNLLDDLLKIGGGSAETYWITANRGMQIDVDKEMDLDTDSAKELSDELEEFQHQLRRYVRTRGVTITPLGAEIADPTGVFSVLMALIASTTGIPQRILMGAEAGQLASAQDRANWSEYMTRRHKIFAEPYVLLPLIERFTALGILPATTAEIEFDWPSTFHQSPLEKAQTQAQFARSIINMSRQAEKGQPVATVKEMRVILDLPAEIPAGDKLPEPPPPPVQTGPFGKPIAGAPGAKPVPAKPPVVPKGNVAVVEVAEDHPGSS